MFKRPGRPVAVLEVPADIKDLKEQISRLQSENDQLRAIGLAQQDVIIQIDDTLRELQHSAPYMLRPVIQAMEQLKLRSTARLPLSLFDQNPQASAVFKTQTGYDTGDFIDAPLASAELLKYRVHTIMQLLSRIIRNENIGASDVQFQAKHDLEVLVSHEKARIKRAQREESQGK